jgi:plastocyanin
MRYAIARRARTLAAGGVLLLALAAAAPAQQAPMVPPNQVVIDSFAFAPATLTVAPGTQVVWINRDEEPHTVTSADGGRTFKSPALGTDDKFTFTFAQPGTYKYFCSIHRYMAGTIVVK